MIELKTKSSPRPIPGQPSTSGAPSSWDYLSVPRRTASLPSSRTVPDGEESCFPHRDSVDISHARMACDEIKDKRSQELIMNSRDSFLITKSRLQAKHPKANRSATPPGGAITWTRFGGLSPIADASPPNKSLLEARKGKQRDDGSVYKRVDIMEESEHDSTDERRPRTKKHRSRSSSKRKVELVEAPTQHPDEHEDCPICEVHRPRWFEAEHREW